MSTRRRRVRRLAAIALAVGVAIQLVPSGRAHSNPPVVASPPWPSDEAAALFERSCAACHSNTTDWPAYSHIAPMSWLVTRDVDLGRDEFNASRWDEDDGEADDAADVIVDGEMPPTRYVLLHPEARLNPAEQRLLIEAFLGMDD